MPLVLTSNDAKAGDRYQWKDVTGVQYHYPNIYRNLIKTGVPFIYYRGVRRTSGPRRPAEYFGKGVIGSIWPDPETADAPPIKKAWYCSIDDFIPFLPTVPAKSDGVFLEQIPANMWRSGVRQLPQGTFDKIVALSGDGSSTVIQIEKSPILPPIGEVEIPTGTGNVFLPKQAKPKGQCISNGGTFRRSPYAKLIGDRAEEIAIEWIKQNIAGAKNIRWVADAGDTPGWDIEYDDSSGALVAVEVKGASGYAFRDFELTANEYKAAHSCAGKYLIMLVANCLGTSPVVQIIDNLAAELKAGKFFAEPTNWLIAMTPQSLLINSRVA